MTILPTQPSLLRNPTIPDSPTNLDLRNIGDAPATRKAIFDRVLTSAQSLKPLSNNLHTLQLADVHYADGKDYTLAEQKRAILGGKTLGRRLRGTWRLVDNATGDVLDEKQTTIAKVPYMTPRGTFIHNGNEYTVSNQQRLRGGIFSRIKDNGEIEAHANILPGKGPSHRYFLDPEKGVFYLTIGQAKIPLMPLMRSLGATDKQLREAWGPDLFATNYQQDNPAAVNKLFERVAKRSDVPVEDIKGRREALKKIFEAMEVDPEVTKRTLGKGYDRINLDTLIATTRKLLAISRGDEDIDDRDALAYQTFLGPEDLFSERLEKDYGGLQKQLLWKSSFRKNLQPVYPSTLQSQIDAVLLNSGLANALEEINPAEIFDKQSRITRMGEGGIPSSDAIPDEARAVQPSHLGFIDPIRTPESMRVGVDVNLSSTVKKGPDGALYGKFKDPRTGKIVWKRPQDVADSVIAFPKALGLKSKRVPVMKGGKLTYAKKREVDLVLPHFEEAFSPLGNMIPFKSTVKGQRVAMGSRMLTQALPLTKPEAPLVQTGIPGMENTSYEQLYGAQTGALRATKPGKVLQVNPESIKVKYGDGSTEVLDLYKTFPFNRKTYVEQQPLVKPGDTFNAGSLLAKSNYTDNTGTTALGLNARVAYLPYYGLNYEDAVVISESFADRLTSEHMYQQGLEFSDDIRSGKRSYVSLFPQKFDKKVLSKLDDDGVIREGETVLPGEPLVLAAKERSTAKSKIHKRRQAAFSDASVLWEHHNPGTVTDVLKSDKGPVVLVKSINKMEVGDKLSGRYGDKGVVSAIVPDDKMPHDSEGRPFELLLSPLGLISRTNPAQAIEAALGKIAEKTGKPYRVADFETIEDAAEYAADELRKHGLTSQEDVIDPEREKKIKGILTGNRFVMKLHHTAESKGAGRGTGGYTLEELPAKGGPTGSKRISLLDVNALLSSGATEVLRDAGAIRGQRNEDYWLQFMQGYTPKAVKVPLVYDKFINSLKGAGINVVPKGGQLHIMALTNRDVRELSGNRKLENAETVNFDEDLSPVDGGLFDPKLTGGHNGRRWSYIGLEEPMPNPVMEEPIRRLLGLTQKRFNDIIAGKENFGEGAGVEAIKRALENINLPTEIARARHQIKYGTKTNRDMAVRKLGYLKSAQQLDIHPKDWILDRVPVLPPAFRPVATMGERKLPLVSDANYLYKELMSANDNLREMKQLVGDAGDERATLYRAFKAVTGLGDPIHPKLVEKRVKGLLKNVFGTSPKTGMVQRRLISSTVDNVGRAVVVPDPDMDMDHIGIPEDSAWNVYKVYIVRRLRRKGMPLVRAMQEVKDRSDLARQELVNEMEDRPVIVNRAPVLHRFGIMAFRPRLVKGSTVHVSPQVVKGFGMDFDGDAVQFHVPGSEEAKQEALDKMLPSRSLITPADFKTPIHQPGQDYVAGLYHASNSIDKKKPEHIFRSIKDAVAAYRRGDIDIDQRVRILKA